jgi:hypothetical protein
MSGSQDEQGPGWAHSTTIGLVCPERTFPRFGCHRDQWDYLLILSKSVRRPPVSSRADRDHRFCRDERTACLQWRAKNACLAAAFRLLWIEA